MQLFSMAFDEGECSFKFKRCLFEYNGRKFMLYPGNERYHMTIDTVVQNESDKDFAFQDIHKFLYSFGWKNCYSFQFLDAATIGPVTEDILTRRNEPFFRIPRKMYSYTQLIWLEPDSCSESLQFMMSLYNDAKHNNNVFFKFLNLYKILDYHFQGYSGKIKKWIDTNSYICQNDIDSMHYYNLSNNGNLSSYLKRCLRNTIAHGYLNPPSPRRKGLIPYKPDDYAKTAEACYILDKLIYHLISNLLGNNNKQVINVLLEE